MLYWRKKKKPTLTKTFYFCGQRVSPYSYQSKLKTQGEKTVQDTLLIIVKC